MIYCDAEPSTEVGTTITLKPGVKVNDNYCYDPDTFSIDYPSFQCILDIHAKYYDRLRDRLI
ncbi:hypothetical protein [Salmonella phage SD-1_S14]|nr:hypothetical protein [Salmonella phage SD-1_S14]